MPRVFFANIRVAQWEQILGCINILNANINFLALLVTILSSLVAFFSYVQYFDVLLIQQQYVIGNLSVDFKEFYNLTTFDIANDLQDFQNYVEADDDYRELQLLNITELLPLLLEQSYNNTHVLFSILDVQKKILELLENFHFREKVLKVISSTSFEANAPTAEGIDLFLDLCEYDPLGFGPINCDGIEFAELNFPEFTLIPEE